MAGLRNLPPRLAVLDVKTVQYQAKQKDPYYYTHDWKELRLSVLRRDRFTCILCGDRATVVDHIVPRRFGGKDEPANCRALCRPCDHKHKEGPTGARRGS